jgi:hypothetical protein
VVCLQARDAPAAHTSRAVPISPYPAAHGVVAISSALTYATAAPAKFTSDASSASSVGNAIQASSEKDQLDIMLGADEPDVMPKALPAEWRPEQRLYSNKEDLIAAQKRNEALWQAKQNEDADNLRLRLETASSGEQLKHKKASAWAACFGFCA